MSQKYLDLAGLTAYDGKIKAWFKAGIVDITNDAINGLFIVGPADNEIWYTSTDGNIVTPDSPIGFGDKIVIVSNTYENGKGVITFDGEITMVGSAAFNACNNLASITIPNSTTYIAVSAFYYCKSLTSVTIPNSVTSIGDYAFEGCSGLTSVTIPNSVTSIGLQAFYSCSGLTSIIYEGTQEQWNVITKGNYWNLLVPATYIQCSDGQVAL